MKLLKLKKILLQNILEMKNEVTMLGNVLLWVAIPFVLSTIFFGFFKGETQYYNSDKYKGNGTAH